MRQQSIRVVIMVATALLSLSFSALAQGDELSAIELTEDERERLQFVSDRGAELLARDDAAWVATDQLMLDINNDPDGASISGWVTTKLDDGTFQVTFVDQRDDGLYAAHQSIIDGREILSSQYFEDQSRRSQVTEDEARIYNARYAAIAKVADEEPCTRTINTAVISSQTGLDVYILAPETEQNTVRMGRHYLVPINADGTAEPPQKFTNSCLLLEKSGGEEGDNVAGLTVTHLLSDIPSEIHVFKSLRHQVPIFVVTTQNKRIWEVSGRNIELIDTISP